MRLLPSSGRPAAVLLALLAACGGPLGLPVDSQGGSDTAEPVVPLLGTLAGQVTDAVGAPVEGAVVTTLPRGYQAVTDAEGGYEIGLLPPDSYQLVAAAPGWVPVTSDAVEVLAEERATLDAQLLAARTEGGRLQVRVLGPDGLPLADAVVTVSDGSAGATDADGELVLEGVQGEDLVVTVQDASDRAWPRTLALTEPLTAAGGAQWEVQLSGRQSSAARSVGSEVCGLCHGDIAARHDLTAHARAAASASELGAELLAAFAADTTVDLGGPTARLWLDGGTPTVTLTDTAGTARSYAVAGTIGDPLSAAVPWTDLGEQGWPLPVGWTATDPSFPTGYPGAQARLDPTELDRWFTAAGRFAFSGAAPDPSLSAEATCLGCHVTGFTLQLRDDGGADMTAAGGSGRWIEGRVGCEQCHGNGSEHLSADDSRRHWVITQPQLLDADRADEICARCHARGHGLDNSLPYAWTQDQGWQPPGGTLADYQVSTPTLWPDQAAAAPNSQSDEVLRSVHGAESSWSARCVDCHAPHGEDSDAAGQPLPAGLRLDHRDNSLCLSCHQALSFEGDLGLAQDHVGHGFYGPDTPTRGGRCTACHMPPTAADVAYSPVTGLGDLHSHLFVALPPQDTLDWFDAVGETQLPAGDFPVHACLECHTLNDWLFEGVWDGPYGDWSLRETHQLFQDATAEMFP